jgi:hypothetical protein
MDDFVFVSALDGIVIGTMPAGLNPTYGSDWSIDDSSFVRMRLDALEDSDPVVRCRGCGNIVECAST